MRLPVAAKKTLTQKARKAARMTPLRVHVRRKNQGMAGIKSVQRKRARAKALPPAPDGYANAVSAAQRYAKENRNKKKVAGPRLSTETSVGSRFPIQGQRISLRSFLPFFAYFASTLLWLAIGRLVSSQHTAPVSCRSLCSPWQMDRLSFA